MRVPRARVPKTAFRGMTARPNISRNEWNTAERGAFGTFAPLFPAPVAARVEVRELVQLLVDLEQRVAAAGLAADAAERQEEREGRDAHHAGTACQRAALGIILCDDDNKKLCKFPATAIMLGARRGRRTEQTSEQVEQVTELKSELSREWF